jgi:hypothetical protein
MASSEAAAAAAATDIEMSDMPVTTRCDRTLIYLDHVLLGRSTLLKLTYVRRAVEITFLCSRSV